MARERRTGTADILAGLRGATEAAKSLGQQRIATQQIETQKEQQAFAEQRALIQEELRRNQFDFQIKQNDQAVKRQELVANRKLNLDAANFVSENSKDPFTKIPTLRPGDPAFDDAVVKARQWLDVGQLPPQEFFDSIQIKAKRERPGILAGEGILERLKKQEERLTKSEFNVLTRKKAAGETLTLEQETALATTQQRIPVLTVKGLKTQRRVTVRRFAPEERTITAEFTTTKNPLLNSILVRYAEFSRGKEPIVPGAPQSNYAATIERIQAAANLPGGISRQEADVALDEVTAFELAKLDETVDSVEQASEIIAKFDDPAFAALMDELSRRGGR